MLIPSRLIWMSLCVSLTLSRTKPSSGFAWRMEWVGELPLECCCGSVVGDWATQYKWLFFMVVPGKSSVKLQIVLAAAQSRQWHGSIPILGRALSLPARQSISFLAMLYLSTVCKVLFVTARPVLGPVANQSCFPHRDRGFWCLEGSVGGRYCSLLNYFSRLLLPHTHFHCLNNELQRNSPTSSFLSFWQTHQHLQTGLSLLFLLMTVI